MGVRCWGSPCPLGPPIRARQSARSARGNLEELFAGSLRSGPLAVVGSRCTMESTPATTKTTEMTGASSLTVVNTAQATNDLGNTSPVGTENFH